MGPPTTARYYVPWVVTPQTPTSTSQFTSYLFLQAENLVISLDGICDIPAEGACIGMGNGFLMFPPSSGLRSALALAEEYKTSFCAAVELTLESSRKRVKRTYDTDVDGPLDIVDSKCQKK